jgi:hypothetical protein
MLGVTTETPAHDTPVAAAVVSPHSDHATSRRFTAPS